MSKQAICVSKAISARPSLPYPYLSVCLSILSPPLRSGVGANKGAGVPTKGTAEQNELALQRAWEQMKAIRQEKDKSVCMDTADRTMVVFLLDLSETSKTFTLAFICATRL